MGVRTPSLENHNFDRFLWKLAFGRPPPPHHTLKKVGPTPSKPRKCRTPSGTLENYSFPNNKPSDPSVKLLNKFKVRTKRTAKKNPQKNVVRGFYCQVGLVPLIPPPPPPPPWQKFLDPRLQKKHNITFNTDMPLPSIPQIASL